MNAIRTTAATICILNFGLTSTVAKEDVAALIDQLGAWNKDKAKKASDELAAMGEQVVPELIEALKSKSRRQRRFAARTLRQIGQDAAEAIPALCASLEYSDALTREYTVEALGKMANQADQVMPVLRQATKDSNQSVREHAQAAIVHLTKLLNSQEQGESTQRPATTAANPKTAAQSIDNNEVSRSELSRSNDTDAKNNVAVLGAYSLEDTRHSGRRKLMMSIRYALFACVIAGFFTLLYVYRENNR
ncbi:MAG: HEAT repeat domain-containing protein [Phycisphaerales bacterium]|nr:MAG: HEAT repeat domain-containing protein [Phycisphaerales bacterium]